MHSTTRERPIDRFQAERELLTPLPTLPFISTRETMRKVSWDCTISFRASRYSAIWQYAAKHVWLRPSHGNQLIIRNQKGVQIARHRLAVEKGSTIIDESHYEGLSNRVPKARSLLAESFRKLFPEHQWFLEGIFIQHRNNGGADHLRGTVGLGLTHTGDEGVLLGHQPTGVIGIKQVVRHRSLNPFRA